METNKTTDVMIKQSGIQKIKFQNIKINKSHFQYNKFPFEPSFGKLISFENLHVVYI